MKYAAQIYKRRPRRRRVLAFLALLVFLSGHSIPASAHPLGNFTINHFTRLEIGASRVRVHYVIDMAEIPAFQELSALNDDSGGGSGTPSAAALDAYATRTASDYLKLLRLSVDGALVPLTLTGKQISLPSGQGGLPTLRIEAEYTGELPPLPTESGNNNSGARRLNFTDANYEGRIGWRELAVTSTGGVQIFDSTAFGNSLSKELREYPNDKLAAPLDERTAALSFTTNAVPAGARALVTREGGKVEVTRDRLAELIAVKDLTLGVALAGLLLASLLGGFHALSPGHGKTIVAAYLIGSRGTAKHAAFLGLTVTVTHTAGVFALGIVTLFAAQYVVPEKLYPVLGFVSGAIVVAIGLSLLVRRIGAAYGYVPHEHALHSHGDAGGDGHVPHTHDQGPLHPHDHDGDGGAGVHSHDGGSEHSHLPPGTNGGPVTWRSLLALGISGGLLPCPSALVVLLAAIAAHRVGYGLLLVVSFSMGLASVLTGIGLLFVYARRWMERPLSASGVLVRVLPALSAFAITCAGTFICYQAVGEAGYSVPGLGQTLLAQGRELFSDRDPQFAQMSALAVLGLGLVFGLKHATEVDHVVAVSSIVSEQRKLWRASLVGGLWGLGHTASLVIVGTVVLVLRVAIPARVASGLEFCVALMIIGLGIATLVRAMRRRAVPVHLHQHRHDGLAHAHLHFHETETGHAESPHSHAVTRIGIKPLIVGAMHGLAGSAALTLLVLAQIPSPLLGLLYLAVFGLGSIVGMLLMSGLVGLPFVLSVRKLTGLHYGLQAGAGVLSVCFGLWYAYETGIANGLFGATF